MEAFTTDYIKKLVDEAGKRSIKAIAVKSLRDGGEFSLSLEFYPNAGEIPEAMTSTVKVPGGPLGLGLLDEEFSPENMKFPGGE